MTLVFIFYFFWIELTWLGCIDSSDRVRVFLNLFVSVSVLKTLVFFFPRLFDTLLLLCQSCFLCLSFGFFYFRVFWLGFSHNGQYWSIILIALLINVKASGRLYFGFGFGSSCFFDQNFPTILLLTFLINLQPN